MRIALISDIHGNDTALEAVLEDIREQGADSIICLGDVATLGPQPREVMDRLKDLECQYVMGNHDAALLEPEKAADFKIAAHLTSSLKWCIDKLTSDDIEFVRAFNPTLKISLGNDEAMLCYHGSPTSNITNIFAETPLADLDTFFAGYTAKIMAGGHTHIQMLRHHNGTTVINPGSSGNVFLAPLTNSSQPTLLPWAEYAIFDHRNGRTTVELKRVPFDVERLMRIIARSDIPLKDWLMSQFKWPLG
jgi:predicted phosphodiesterase